jgi:hypothetical protein
MRITPTAHPSSTRLALHSLTRSCTPRQVGLWGAESGDEYGNGETYDGDGIGINRHSVEDHP